jgi:hypothetical protein
MGFLDTLTTFGLGYAAGPVSGAAPRSNCPHACGKLSRKAGP